MERSVLSWVCIFALVALPATGCSDESTAAGGTGGSGDTGGGGGLGGVGGSGDLCEGAEDCDDGNDCTEDVCNPEGRTCSSMAIADGTGCAGGACEAGQCALGGSVLPCSEQGIRNAIAAGGGPYTFDCDGTMPVVTEAEIVIDNDVELDGEGNLTVDGNEDHGVFFVAEGVTAGLRGVTVTGGEGLGIGNLGWLTLTNSTVSDNGEGILTGAGRLTLTNSTVSGNGTSAIAHCGGSITIANSTVSGQLSYGSGQACGFPSGSDEHSIISSLIEGRCFGGRPPSSGYNIESPGDTCGFDQGTDQVDVSAEELNLGPLADNGGGTETRALGEGSVAIDVIPADMCEVDEDQRGFPRDSMCDVGAFEVQEGSL